MTRIKDQKHTGSRYAENRHALALVQDEVYDHHIDEAADEIIRLTRKVARLKRQIEKKDKDFLNRLNAIEARCVEQANLTFYLRAKVSEQEYEQVYNYVVHGIGEEES